MVFMIQIILVASIINDWYGGYIDDFRIYDKALTAQEISDIYNDTEPLVGGSSSSTTTGTIDTTNMLVWYKFDDTTNIGLDSSGNNNDGTLQLNCSIVIIQYQLINLNY